MGDDGNMDKERMWMAILRILSITWFILEAWLSHTPGERSGKESKSLSAVLHVNESFLRKAAHVVMFMILAALVAVSFPPWCLWLVAGWALVDEVTKPLVPGRHFSWPDVGLNLLGTAVGFAAGYGLAQR